MVIAVTRRVNFHLLQCLRLHYKEEKDDSDYNNNDDDDATAVISISNFISGIIFSGIISFITSAAPKWMW